MICSIGYIWWPYAFLSNCPLVNFFITPSSHMALLSNFTSGWPWLTPAWPLIPAMSYTLIRGSSYQIWWPYSISKQFDLWLTPADPCMTFDLSNALCSGHAWILPTEVGGHKALLSKLTPTWPQLTPSWPLIPAMQYAWSGILPTKFGGHRAFLSNLAPGWPQMTLAWPLTPALHYALVNGSFHQI